jgi:Carboxypeptidase regulatory-like domain
MGRRSIVAANGVLLGSRMIRIALASLTLVLPLLAQSPDGEKKFAVIEGHVVNAASGDPIRKAVVRLSEHHADRVKGIVGTTDAEGTFHFKHVAPGEYSLSADKNGFLETSYDSVLAVKAGEELKDITLKLSPAAAIEGRVVDEDGEPVPGAEVTLWYRQTFLGQNKITQHSRPASTNTAGEYRIDGLSPGRYFVSANRDEDSEPNDEERVVDSRGDPVLLNDALTYYPSSLLFEGAAPVDVTSGQESRGVDIRLRRSKTYRISGKVAFEGSATAEYEVSAYQPQRGQRVNGKVTPQGEFTVQGLLPGSYEVRLLQPGRATTLARTLVEVTDADRVGITLKPYLAAQVKVRVAIEGRPQALPPFISYLRKSPIDISTSCDFEDGTCRFRNIEPGKYVLDIRGLEHGYIKSVQSGSQAVNPRALAVPDGGDLALDVVWSSATGQIEGEVLPDTTETGEDKSQHAWSSIMVALAPVLEDDDLFELPHATGLDQYGHFSFQDVRPGRYRLYAEQTETYHWDNPDFVREMQSMGTQLELRPKDTIHLQLKRIPKEETMRIMDKLGIK